MLSVLARRHATCAEGLQLTIKQILGFGYCPYHHHSQPVQQQYTRQPARQPDSQTARQILTEDDEVDEIAMVNVNQKLTNI